MPRVMEANWPRPRPSAAAAETQQLQCRHDASRLTPGLSAGPGRGSATFPRAWSNRGRVQPRRLTGTLNGKTNHDHQSHPQANSFPLAADTGWPEDQGE